MGEDAPDTEQTAEEMVAAMNAWAAAHNAAVVVVDDFDPSSPISQPASEEPQCP